MSEKIKDGGPAFPRPPFTPMQGHDQFAQAGFAATGHAGMSLRDWFAGQALAVMTAAPDYSKGPCDHAIADRAYVIADAMLKAREGVK